MTLIGMDPNEVLKIARKLETQHKRVTTVAAAVDSAIQQARSSWRGPDVEQFAAHWNGTHKASLRSAGDALGELASKARSNAAAQEKTSQDYAGGSSAGGGPGMNGGPKPYPVAAPGGPPGSGGQLPSLKDLWNGTSAKTSGSVFAGVRADGSTSGSVAGIPVSAKGDAYAGAGADGQASAGASLKDGAYANASGKAYAGVGADGSYSVGNKYLSASGDGHVFAGAQANGEAGAKIGLDGADVHAKGEAFAGARADAHTYVGNQYINQSVDGTALAGADAKGDASASIGPLGGSAGAHVDAFAGAKAGVTGDQDVVGVHATEGVSVETGIGFSAGGDANFGANNIGFDADLGACLGGGADVKIGLHVNPTEVLDDAGSVAKSGWHAVSSLGGLL